MAGRRPKPTALHRLEGTFHTGKHGRDRAFEPIAEGDLRRPPQGLTDAQLAIWRYAIRHAPKGVLKQIDRDLLLVWCEARARWEAARDAQARLDQDTALPLLIRTPMGLVASPYNDILEKTARTMIRVAQDLGFSPAARPRLKVIEAAPQEAADNPWAALRLIGGGKTE